MDAPTARQPCAPCKEPFRPVGATTVAVVVLLTVCLVCYVARRLAAGRREGFSPERVAEVYTGSRGVFDETGGKASYSEYKTRVPDADPVLYNDMRRLWKAGDLTPRTAERAM
jgi:hypothetical protein